MKLAPPSFPCLSRESSRCAPARRKDSFQPKDLGWLDPCDKPRDEGGERTRHPRTTVSEAPRSSARSGGCVSPDPDRPSGRG
ncbi:hypothetical protein C9410_11705 [Rhizobium sp. SEMIA 439]|nr:hypothetical protein F7R04_08850 [Agrobacterium tumefaciens]QAA98284.1 hypothetical protein DC439_11790 [Agrobacterium tumefaciens]TGE80827.1 hypothetical protein C9410_11705 [Rhizobium sp. SEMIA 439]